MAIRKLTWVARVDDSASPKIGEINKKFSGMSGQMKKLSGGMTSLGGKLKKSITLPLAGVGTLAAKTTSDFDDGMSKVRALTGAVGDDFDKLREKAIQLGNDTAFSALDASEGMQILAASGMEVNDILKTSGDMLTLMSAGTVDADTAASVLTNTMAQFNLTADDSERIIDGFAQGAASAKLGVEDLEYIMGQAGGTLASMNMEMEESIAMAGQLANAGTPIGTIGTTLNAMGREVKASAKEFKQLGIEVYDSNGKLKGLDTVMMELEGALDGMSDAQRDAALSSVFSGQAMKGAVDWLSLGSSEYKKLAGEINEAEGAALNMAEVMEDNFGGAVRSLKSALGTVLIGIGDVLKGPLQKGADKLKDLAGAFNDLDPDKKGLIVKLGLLAASIGPILSVGGKLLGLFAKFPAVFSPVTLVVGAVIGAFTHLYKTNEEFAGRVDEFFGNMREKFSGALEFLDGLFIQVKEKIGEFFENSNLIESLQGVFEGVMTFMEGIMNVFTIVVDVISGVWNALGENIMNVIGIAMDFIGSTVEAGLDIVSGLFEMFGSILQGDWESAWESLKGIVTSFVDWFKEIPGKIIEAAKEIGQGVKNGLSSAGNWAYNNTIGRITGKKRRSGVTNVPYDGYPIEAHKGEMLLTKSAADEFRSLGGTKSKIPTVKSPRTASSANISYSPKVNINIQNADKNSAMEFERRVERILERERKIFLAKLKLGGGELGFS